MMLSTDSSFYFVSPGEGEAADVSEVAGNIMATAASLRSIALQTGAPGFLDQSQVSGMMQ